MELAKVKGEVRKQCGKGSTRRARVAGQVPCVVYGHKDVPVAILVDEAALIKSLDKEKKRNTVFSLSFEAPGGAVEQTVMIKDVQINALSRGVEHVDFIRVRMDEEVKVMVPLVLHGTPAGVVAGGSLHQDLYQVPVVTTPATIPNKIEADVSTLQLGGVLHVGDLTLPPGVRVSLGERKALASVVAPRVEEEKAVAGAAVAGAAAEGEAAAPGAEAAACKEPDGEKDKKARDGDKKSK
jgi:large subunit ribosomal protein L25